MIRQQRILDLLKSLNPIHALLENESDQHAGPSGRETHFKLLLVSEKFSGLSRVDRQRLVHDLLKNEFASGLHALTLRLLTEDEWKKSEASLNFVSPDCGHKK